MPPITVHTASPINATKADGQTPQTAQPVQESSKQQNRAYVPATATSGPEEPGYPAAQPAARPSQPAAPAPTGVSQQQTSLQPTPTQSLPADGPPAPQPGAVPVPPASHLPPPPKAGEKLQQPPTTASAMPPQMSYPAPTSQYAAGKSTSTYPTPSAGAMPTSLQAGGGDSFNHPPGYRQDVHASDMSSAQRSAHEASVRDNSQVFDTGDDEGVWGTMKKWGTTVGNNLAAAENEVWKRINKD